MVLMRPLGSLALVGRTVRKRVVDPDRLEAQDPVLDVDVALGFRGQVSPAGVDPARFQRAAKCAGQSTGRRGDDVVKRGGVVRILAGRRAVVLTDLVVRAEDHRLGLGGQECLPDRTPLPNDSHPGDVRRPGFHFTKYLTGPKHDSRAGAPGSPPRMKAI